MISAKKLVLLILILATAGCSSTGSNSFKDMSSAYRDVIEQYNNDNLLLNIIRVSNNMPMSFLDIPSIVGSGTIIKNANVSGLAVTTGSATSSEAGIGFGMSINNSFSFTQSSLDNNAFISAFYKPIPLEAFGLKATERLRPRLIDYLLLVDEIQFKDKSGDLILLIENDPLTENFDQVLNTFRLLIELGLRVEQIEIKKPIGPTFDKLSAINQLGSEIIQGVIKENLAIDVVGTGSAKSYQLSRVVKENRFCINKFRTEEVLENLISPTMFCKISERLPKLDDAAANELRKILRRNPNLQGLTFTFSVRSTGNVFDYLGNILIASQRFPSRQINVTTSLTDHPTSRSYHSKPKPLFKIHVNKDDIKSVANVNYRGNTYAVADDDDTYTKMVLEYLSNLITFAKVPGSIPPSPAIIMR